MKKLIFALLVIPLLSACAVTASPPVLPSATTIAPTAAEMNPPLYTATPLATPTSIPIPSFMDEFIAKGYDRQVAEDNTIYVVLNEASLKYSLLESGIQYQDLIIFSWFTVSYFDSDHNYRESIVLNNVCKTGGENDGRFTSALTDGSQITSVRACPGMAYFRGQNRDLFSALPGDEQILKAFLGTGHDKNKDMVFEGIFHDYSNSPQGLTILEIGEILPVTIFRLPDLPTD